MIGVTATSTGGELAAALLKLRTGDLPTRIVRRNGKRMQALLKDTWPVDTGALSIANAVQTKDESDYAERAAAAGELNPRGEQFPEPAPPSEPGHAVVLCIMTYGEPVNNGSIHGPAQPGWDRARVETAAALQADAETEWSA